MPRNNYYFCSRSTTGNLIEAGLPNITGSIESANSLAWNKQVTGTGALSEEHNSVNCANAGNNAGVYTNKFILDAANSSSIYGNSNTVQPLSVACYLEFYIN